MLNQRYKPLFGINSLFPVLLISLFLLVVNNISQGQNSKLLPGFDKKEYLELLKVSSRQNDTMYNPEFPDPQKFKMIYRSATMGMDNRWDLWVSDDSMAVVSIRGTTAKADSWLENFYSAMVPAQGELTLSKDFTFRYDICSDKRAAIHTGWLIGTAFLSSDIKPKLDSLAKAGIHDVYIIGHSQGGAIAYLLTSYFLGLSERKIIPASIHFKTYCSAAPKPGNLYYAYYFENLTKGGWAYNVVNSADWVPETPFSIQTTLDFNTTNPFTEAHLMLKKQPIFKRIALTHFYNSLEKPTFKANHKFQRRLGKDLAKFVKSVLPDFIPPTYFNSNNYVRVGSTVVLYADADYYKLFPDEKGKIWTHHSFEAYLYLAEKYNVLNFANQNFENIPSKR